MEPIIFGITIIVVAFLFLLQINKQTNSFLATVSKIEVLSQEERRMFLTHINRLEDRIQTGDAKQAAFLNREKEPETDRLIKPRTVNIGTATGLEAERE